jgi:hypothetical protein
MRFKSGDVNSAKDSLWGWQHNYLERNSLQSICRARQAMRSDVCVGVLVLSSWCLQEQGTVCFHFAAPHRETFLQRAFAALNGTSRPLCPVPSVHGYQTNRVYNLTETQFIPHLDLRICVCVDCLLLLIYMNVLVVCFRTLSASKLYIERRMFEWLMNVELEGIWEQVGISALSYCHVSKYDYIRGTDW